MANTIDFNVGTNAVTVLNQTGEAASNASQQFTSAKAELRALTQQMLQLDASSAEFKKASARASELKDRMEELGENVRVNIGNSFEQASNSVSLFTGRLMGGDLKGAGDALTNLGGAVSKISFKEIQQEVGGLAKGLLNLGKAVLANPFFLAAGALTAMIVYYKEIGDAINGTAEKVKKLEESNVVLEKQNLILDNRINKEKTLYGESFKTLELEKEKARNNISVAENELAIARTTGDINAIREKENRLIETRNLLSGITAAGEGDRLKGIEKAKELTIEGYKEEEDRKKAIAEFEDLRAQQLAVIAEKQRMITANLQKEELLGTEQQYTTERANFVQKDIETKKVLVVSDRQKQLQAELNQLLEDEKHIRNAKLAIATGTTVNELKAQELALQKDLNNENKTAEQLQKELEANAVKAAKELKLEKELADLKLKVREDYIKANQGAQANELYELEKKKELELQTWEGAEEDKVFIIEKYRLAEIDINTKYDDLALEQQIAANEKKKQEDDKAKQDELERQKQFDADKLEAERALTDAKFNLASASVDLLGTLFAKNKKAADIAFALDKALAIAQVVVNTQREISAYNANPVWSLAPDGGASIKIPAIIGAKLRAAASIATIAGTAIGRFAGGGASGGSGAGANGGGGTAAPSPANFAFVGNQPNQQQPPLQAYVVGTQVSSNLEAQQLIQNQSRLGG